jgi:hypothetical protein
MNIKPCENSREKFRYTVQNSGFKIIHDAIMTPEVDVNLDIMLFKPEKTRRTS